MKILRAGFAALALSLSLSANPAAAGDIALSPARLTERGGTQMSFLRDAIGDHVVVIGFTWGGCTTVCPITDRIMADAQTKMGRRLGPVRMLTVTLDPFGDPPSALARRAAELGAGRNWLWLGGDFKAVNLVLAGLGARARPLASHAPMFLVVDGRNRRFTRRIGLPRAEELVADVDRMLATRTR